VREAFDAIRDVWPHLVAVSTLAAMIVASAHAILYKRDVRAAIGWAGLIWLVPGIGAVLYLLFGINRIKRRATALREGLPRREAGSRSEIELDDLVARLPAEAVHLETLAELLGRVQHRPLVDGNAITILRNGDEAFPAMLEAIAGARRSVALATYIFEGDRVGERFRAALAAAVARGVEVRVLVDDVGRRYSLRSGGTVLRRAGIPAARFNPTSIPWHWPYANLRNHRKILVVDGAVGFTGGLNLRDGHLLGERPRHPVRDLHFRLEGPVVGQLMETFREDWLFTTGERLEGEAWLPSLERRGETPARALLDGPDEDLEVLHWKLLGALATARSSVRIVTPYFLPGVALVHALGTAALRGVEVDVVLPAQGNLVLVQWAAMAQIWQVIERGCRVWLTPPPFDHTKLLVVDGAWASFGSSNWDPRSLRLNFELDVECYDPRLARELEAEVAARIAIARPLTLAEADGRSLPVRLRDGVARLFAPYL